ncbi:MAG: tRNA (adenosine(37)-N6)-threonylcarbamoyltransferase complex dimerization subunit type 1 TsaB [Pelodictyon phaeoclathratiforme]
MNILAIECTHAALSVAVTNAGVVTEARSADWKKAAETLVPLIEQVMAESALNLKQLDCIAISSGPGSFTALRIGMAIAKGVAYGLGIPLVPVPTMPAMAASLQAESGSIMAVIPSRKGEYYFASYFPEELASGLWHDEVKRGSASDVVAAISLVNGRAVVLGRGLNELIPLLADSGAVYREADFFSASSLFPAAQRLFAGADAAELNGVTPDYRQMFTPNGGGV